MKYLLFLLLWLPGLVCGQVITTIVGGGSTLGDGGPATSASIDFSLGICFDRHGNTYIADANNHRIRKINAVTGIITTIAGNGTSGYNGDGIPASSALLNLPAIVICDTSNNLFIADGNNYRIRKIDAITGLISTIAGNGTSSLTGDGGPATAATILAGGNMLFDALGNLYFQDRVEIRKINTLGIVTCYAGNGTIGITSDSVTATSTPVNPISGFCINKKGDIFLDDGSCAIRKIDAITGIITRIAGKGDSSCSPYSGDGIKADTAHFSSFGLAIDFIGNLYVSDFNNARIEKIDTFGYMQTIAGIGTHAFSGDGGPATNAEIKVPENVVLDNCGNIYIADFGNLRFRKITVPSNPYIGLNGINVGIVGSSITVNADVANAGGYYSIKWYNKGILFATTTTPSVTYTKTMCSDSITAMVYGCSDSALSGVHVVGCTASIPPAPFLQGRKGVTCYPNPVRSELRVFSEEALKRVVITNLLGQVVYTSNAINEREFVVPVEGFAGGVYFVKVGFGDGSVVVDRFVKE